ncbi:MAG: hypothetical protein OXE44_04380 [Nitrospinae bacterium]|nr:hypothetical protein [Nitrospinota bacterium]
MKILAVLVFLLSISGCVSVEELAQQELGTIEEHQKIFVDCKTKRKAAHEWLKQEQTPMNAHEVGDKAMKVYTDCLEEHHPGLMFLDKTATTSLEIYSKNMLRFRTGGDHLIEEYFKRSRRWNWALHEGKEPFVGYWTKYSEALERWRKFYKGEN